MVETRANILKRVSATLIQKAWAEYQVRQGRIKTPPDDASDGDKDYGETTDEGEADKGIK